MNWKDDAVENKVGIGRMKQLVQSCIDFDAHLRPKLLDRLGERMRSCLLAVIHMMINTNRSEKCILC